MSASTKFTIIIPTRERADTLQYTLQNVVSQEYDNFEVLVSDNASEDNTRQVVEKIQGMSSRVRYINTGCRLSMSKNWEFALNHVDAGWVTFLGDDDGILSGALSYVDQIIRETGVSAVASSACGFVWPNEATGARGTLSIYINDGYALMDSKRALRQVLSAKLGYSILPMVYRGFVDTNLVKQAKEMTGIFFQSLIPDVYSAIALTLLTDRFVLSNRPTALDGHSHHSGGAAALSHKKTNLSYNPAQKFESENDIPFHRDFPLLPDGKVVRSIQAIVYESFLQAAPFHKLKDIHTSHEEQLYLIMRDTSPHLRASVVEWSRSFAELHGLDIEAVQRQIKGWKTKIYLMYRRLKGYLFYIRNIVEIDGTGKLPLNTIYDAGIVASTILNIKPSFHYRLNQIIRKAIRRLM